MDAFEQLVAEIFYSEGYWVQTSVKVLLTKEEKVLIGRHSSPRWELDVVAYKPSASEMLVIECKSFLDSTGVNCAEFQDGHPSTRYKLFREPVLREVVLGRLRQQMVESGRCTPDVNVKLGLIAGKVKRGNHEALRHHFEERDWILHGPEWLRDRLRDLASDGYSNQVSSVVAKLLLRNEGILSPAGATNTERASRTSIPDDTPLQLLVSDNPKVPGTQAFERFKGYFLPEATTVGTALSCGLRRDDIRNDVAKGYIQLGSS